MEQLIDWGDKILFQYKSISISVNQTIILIVGLLLIIIVNVLVKRFIKRNHLFNSIGDRLKKLISRGLSYFIWTVGLIVLLRLENVNTQSFFAYVLLPGEKVTITVQTIFILVVIFFIIQLVVLLVDYLMNRKIERDHLDFGKGKSVLQITKYVIWIAGILIGIGAIGLKLTFIIASVSALLVGVGFGLQNIFNDFFSGIILLFDGSIKVDDVVEVGDIVGRVKEIGVRTTKVLDRNNIILIIPNSKFTTDQVINWSHLDQKSRFSVAVGVAYGSDVRLVEKLLLDCALENEDVERQPDPFVRFVDFGESSLDFLLFFWTNNTFGVENVKSHLRFAIDQKFREHNITIPFPQRDIHIITKQTQQKIDIL